jgi:RNA polymerase sigma-70 factor (ECF subfamily)
MAGSPIHDPAVNSMTGVPSDGHETQDAAGDLNLVVAARRGDHQAFAALVDRCGVMVHAMLLHLVNGNRELAEELLQDAFVRAWERLDRFDGGCRFSTWMWRLARNRALDRLAKKRPEAMGEHLEQVAGGAPGRAAEGLERDESRQAVQRALAQLEPDDRALILARDFAGHDYETLAQDYEVPVGTIKSRLHRARAALRSLLADAGVMP